MPETPRENHLDVYPNRSELFLGRDTPTAVFPEGPQDAATQRRYRKIVEAFRAGFLEKVYRESVTGRFDFSRLPEDTRKHLKNMVAAISATGGRALAGLVFL